MGQLINFFNKEPSEFNGSLEFGSAIHELVLQPDDFELIDYQFKPPAKLGKFIEGVSLNLENKSILLNSIKFIKKIKLLINYLRNCMNSDDKRIKILL